MLADFPVSAGQDELAAAAGGLADQKVAVLFDQRLTLPATDRAVKPVLRLQLPARGLTAQQQAPLRQLLQRGVERFCGEDEEREA